MPARHARGVEQALWIAIYVLVVLGPIAVMAVAAKPGAQGPGVVVAAALGFAGLSVMVLQGLISGRWAAITRAFGLRSVLNLHRQAGLAALILVVGHVVVLMVDDPGRLALLDQRGAPLRAQAGLAALLAMVAIATSSMWRARIRMSYERWRAIHVICGFIVLVGSFVHILGVSAYVSLPALRWAVLFLVVIGGTAIFLVRVARPYALVARAFRVRRVTEERGNAVSVELEADGHRGLHFRPGQFAWLKGAARPYGMDEHPFTISSSADRPGRVEFTVKAIGDYTAALRELAPGTPLLIDGPHGEQVHPDPAVPGRLLLAAGIGITPAMSVLRSAADSGDGTPTLLLYGNRRWQDITFREELLELGERLPALRVVHVLSQPHEIWQGERGRVDETLLRRFVTAEMTRWSALICGPPQMVAGAAAALRRLGLPAGAIQAEGFG